MVDDIFTVNWITRGRIVYATVNSRVSGRVCSGPYDMTHRDLQEIDHIGHHVLDVVRWIAARKACSYSQWARISTWCKRFAMRICRCCRNCSTELALSDLVSSHPVNFRNWSQWNRWIDHLHDYHIAVDVTTIFVQCGQLNWLRGARMCPLPSVLAVKVKGQGHCHHSRVYCNTVAPSYDNFWLVVLSVFLCVHAHTYIVTNWQ